MVVCCLFLLFPYLKSFLCVTLCPLCLCVRLYLCPLHPLPSPDAHIPSNHHQIYRPEQQLQPEPLSQYPPPVFRPMGETIHTQMQPVHRHILKNVCDSAVVGTAVE